MLYSARTTTEKRRACLKGLSRDEDFDSLVKSIGIDSETVPAGHYLTWDGRDYTVVPWHEFTKWNTADLSDSNTQMSWRSPGVLWEGAMIWDSTYRFAQIFRWLMASGVPSAANLDPHPHMVIGGVSKYGEDAVEFRTYNWVVLGHFSDGTKVVYLMTMDEVFELHRSVIDCSVIDCTDDDLEFGNPFQEGLDCTDDDLEFGHPVQEGLV